jgi:NitT/TauT family transport system substrate-binding protein
MTGQMCSRRYLLASVAAGLFARSLTPFANAQNAPSLRVGTLPIEEGAQVYYAQERGFLPQLRLDVRHLPHGAAVVAAVAAGEIQLGFCNLFAFAQAFARGSPVRVLAAGQLFRVEDSKSFALVVRADAPYHAAKDLNGKKIGAASPVSIVGIGPKAWIDRNGGDSSTVEVVQVPFGTVEQALETGRVDAVSATLSDLAAVKNIEIRVLGYPTDAIGPPFIGSAWYAHTAWISANRELARRCAQTLIQAAQWANAHQDESGQLLTKYLGLTPEAVRGLKGHRVIYGERLDPSLMQPVISVAARVGIIPKAFPAGDAIADLT